MESLYTVGGLSRSLGNKMCFAFQWNRLGTSVLANMMARFCCHFLISFTIHFVILRHQTLAKDLCCDWLHLLWLRSVAKSLTSEERRMKPWSSATSTPCAHAHRCCLSYMSKDVEILHICCQANTVTSIRNDTALTHHTSAIFHCVSGPVIVFSHSLCTQHAAEPSYEKKGQKATFAWLSPGPADFPHVDLTL